MQQSPFENIFNIIGGITEGNEKPMKHGFYNAFALFVLAICCAAVYVLFLILEPFFKPLFWALLVGSLLHPFKYRLSRKIKTWFENLDKSDSSMVVALMITPLSAINYASDTVGNQFRKHYKTIIAIMSAVFILPWLYNAIPRSLCCIFSQLSSFIGFSTSLLINVCTSYITLTIALAYIISVYTLWSPKNSGFFRLTSHVLWLVIASFLSNIAGSYRVYMFVLLQTIAVTGFILEVLHFHKLLQLQDPEASIITAIHNVLTCTNSNIKKLEGQKIDEKHEDTIHEVDSEKESTPDIDSPTTPEGDVLGKRGSWAAGNDENPIRNVRQAKMLFKTRTMSALPLGKTKTKSDSRLLSYRQQSLDDNYIRNNFTDDETALYFKLLFSACFCMLVWKHIWLLPVMLFFLAIHTLKNLLNFFGVWLFFQNHLNNVMSKVKIWWEQRQSALLPAQVRGVGRIMSICNRSVKDMAYESVDTVSTCIVIVGLILFLTVAIVFICIQIYSEAIVVVQLSGSLLNSTFVQNSELHAYLPEGWEEKLDSLIDNAYTYGREGISTGVKSILREGDPEKIAKVEQQVLEIWDRVYQSWVSGHFAATTGPQVDGTAVQDSWDNFVSDVTAMPDMFDYSGLVAWVRANVGTLSALATGVWAPLASNVSLLAGSLGAVTSLLLSGSGAIINMFINLVVFFTTLFYLLASSSAFYKPVEVITRVQPSFGSRLGIALSVAINQVFRASFKMALFYGLWTWLVHNFFGAKVVYLPSGRALVLCGLCCATLAARINFSGCQQPWTCDGTEIVYTCSLVASDDFIVHIKDFYTENAASVVIQNCRDVRVALDCPTLQRASRLQHFKIKDCDRLEFVTVSGNTIQTPPEFTIQNVREVVALPRNIFKSPSTSTEQQCMGATHFRKLFVVSSKINVINTKAISNVTQPESVVFENVTIGDIDNQGIEIIANSNKTAFTIINSKILNLDFRAVAVQGASVKLVGNDFGDIRANAVNITAETLLIQGNTFREINTNCIMTSAIKTDISDNDIKVLKTNALAGVKCAKNPRAKEIKFTRNKVEKVEPLSLYFDYGSCKTNTLVEYRENRVDCKCRSISFLTTNNDLNDIILDTANNNTCHMDACTLPVEVVKLLLDNDMCHLDLDPQVMCLLYNDKHSSDATTDGEVTEAPTFYLIRQANTLHDGAAMTAIDKDDLLRDNLDVTNRTTVKVVFDSSRDFVETLRSTSGTTKSKAPSKEEYVNSCVGGQCKNTVQYDKQKALEFYKYVYAQLRTPRLDVPTKH